MREVLTISALNRYVKSILHEIPYLANVEVRGEIINLKRYTNAAYFTLKEGDAARISAVTFNLGAFPSTLKDGDEVICRGQVSLYEKGGTYQLICRDVNYYGLGAKLVALEALKVKLEKTGIFKAEHKRPLPRFPQIVGVIVPKDSAAQSDIVTNIGRRYPLVKLIVAHATFQGDNATPSLINAFNTLNNENIDILIIARGGGSSDDLWAFNDETLVLALVERKMPLISAIGHEIDTTLVDYLADVRASTPTAAAELAVPDINELRQDVINLEVRLSNVLNHKLHVSEEKVTNLVYRPVLLNFGAIINNISASLVTLQTKLARLGATLVASEELKLHKLSERVNNALTRTVSERSEKLNALTAKLNSLNPNNVLERGYALISRADHVISRASDLNANDLINITFSDGKTKAIIQKGEEDE